MQLSSICLNGINKKWVLDSRKCFMFVAWAVGNGSRTESGCLATRCVCLFVSLFVCLFVCLFARLFVCSFVSSSSSSSDPYESQSCQSRRHKLQGVQGFLPGGFSLATPRSWLKKERETEDVHVVRALRQKMCLMMSLSSCGKLKLNRPPGLVIPSAC